MSEDPLASEAEESDGITITKRITFPVVLWQRIENATRAEGYSDSSKLVVHAVGKWIGKRESKRHDGQYPPAPPRARTGPKPGAKAKTAD